jgi:hypothetical protein
MWPVKAIDEKLHSCTAKRMSSNYKYNDFQQIQILPLLKENKQISHKKQKQMSKVGYPYIIYLQYSIKCKVHQDGTLIGERS